MKLCERIREFVWKEYILPAKENHSDQLTIRAGDVHKKMGLHQRMPAVCSAITTKMEDMYDIELVELKGPPSGQGANVFVTYRV